MTRRTVLLLAATALGCTPRMVLPPTSTGAFLETPHTAAPGEQRIEGAACSVGELFSAGLGAATLGYTRGIGERTELTIAPVFQVYNDGTGRVANFERKDSYGYGADVRIKTRPFDTKHFATFIGLGGLVNHYASIVAPSLGASLAFENDYFVPFLTAQVYAAAPLHGRDVLITETTDPGTSATPATTKTLHPTTTVGGLASAGFQVKIAKVVSLKAALTGGAVHSQTDDLIVLGAALGAGAAF